MSTNKLAQVIRKIVREEVRKEVRTVLNEQKRSKTKVTKKHYENFPVATLLFPKAQRDAATILYSFARNADDIADEGNLTKIERKKFRVTNKVKKVAPNDRFRLCISRSAKNISAQIIDDSKNITLLSASSIEKDIKSGSKINKTELSKIVAEKLAKKAQEKKITKIFFDRGIYKYHGRVKIFAETLRKNGMDF